MGIHNPVQRNARPGQWDDQPHGGAPHVYKRANSKNLIEKQADGGIGERKRITEYADRHGILIAPHGSFSCLIALAAHVHLARPSPGISLPLRIPPANPTGGTASSKARQILS